MWAVLWFPVVPQVCGHPFRELEWVMSWCLRGLDSVQVFTVTLAKPLNFSDSLNLRGNPCFLWREMNFYKIYEAVWGGARNITWVTKKCCNIAVQKSFRKASENFSALCRLRLLSTSDHSSCCLQPYDFADTFLASVSIALQSRNHLFMCSHFWTAKIRRAKPCSLEGEPFPWGCFEKPPTWFYHERVPYITSTAW